MEPANIAAARQFLHLVTKAEARGIAALARSLDELALRYHDTPLGDPDERDLDLPNDRIGYAQIGDRFPDLGYYAVASPLGPAGEGLVGDAIDDLTDIANELREVIWRFEHGSADDAHWHFRFPFEAHWGRHLRELANYLHALQFG